MHIRSLTYRAYIHAAVAYSRISFSKTSSTKADSRPPIGIPLGTSYFSFQEMHRLLTGPIFRSKSNSVTIMGCHLFCFRILSMIWIVWATRILENLLNTLNDAEIEPSGKSHLSCLKVRLNKLFNLYKGRKFDTLRNH